MQQTRGIFSRWGVPSLMVAKFVPGFAAVATVLTGESRTPMRTFLFYDGIGALLWSAVGFAIGVLFHDAVSDALLVLEAFGHVGALLLAAAVLAFLAWKWRQRRRFVRALRVDRVSSAELLQRMQSGESPLILDVRGAGHRDRSGWIPGSIHVVALDEAAAHAGQEVVVYCDCPDEASAAALALALRRRGIARVRPLAGGFEGWRGGGNPIETLHSA